MVRIVALLLVLVSSSLADEYNHKGKGDKAEAAPILCTPVKVGAENIESIPFAELLATNFGTDQIQGGIGNGGMGGDYNSPGGFG
ncbi:hypothetical protein HF086_013214, partial [Spodoptera exigua]